MTFTPTDYLPYDFANRRHIGPSPVEMDEMLTAVGAEGPERAHGRNAAAANPAENAARFRQSHV